MLEAIFAPRSVAVVGASPDPARLGHSVLKNIIEHGYEGAIFPIHPTAGSLATAHHTGSLAGSESAYEAAFAQSGILRAHTVSELFDLAMIFSMQPLIQGDRVAIVTNSGGMGIIATNAVERSGLRLAAFGPATVARLQPEPACRPRAGRGRRCARRADYCSVG